LPSLGKALSEKKEKEKKIKGSKPPLHLGASDPKGPFRNADAPAAPLETGGDRGTKQDLLEGIFGA